MENFQNYKEKVEKQFNQNLKDLIINLYITNEQGPSVSAKQLGIPRKAFIYFVNQYGLKQRKLDKIKKSASLNDYSL